MNLTKSLKIGLLFAGLTLCVFAEIRIINIPVYKVGTADTQRAVDEVNNLLNKGWNVKAVTASGPQSVVTIVLESPKEKTK